MSDQPVEELDERHKEALKIKKDYEGLTRHPGWVRLMLRADSQRQARADKLLGEPTSEAFTAAMQDFLKGEREGIRLFQEFPKIEMDAAKAVVESFEGEVDEQGLDGSPGADAGGDQPTTTGPEWQ